MGQWRDEADRWLTSEPHDDEAAEASFAQLFTALPEEKPSAGFVQRTVAAAWAARVRRRRLAAGGAAAAALAALGGAALVSAYGAPGWVLMTVAQVAAGSLTALLASAATLVEFGALMVRTGSAVGRVMVMPQGIATLVAIEVVGAGALYALHRLLRDDLRFRNSGPLCL